MTRQDSFEQHWADVHDLPVETLAQYRWKDKDGYRLPGIAAGYRNFCAGWDAANFERTAHFKIDMSKIDFSIVRDAIATECDIRRLPGVVKDQIIKLAEFKGKDHE
jgi:hypothetical protein